jgi:hypothetical protein
LNITSISGLARHMRQTTAEYWDSPWRYSKWRAPAALLKRVLPVRALCVCL